MPPRIDSRVENRPSRARSDVGRVPRPRGTWRRRPPAIPPPTLLKRPPPRPPPYSGTGCAGSCFVDVVGALRVEELAHRGDQRVVARQRRVLIDEAACLRTRRGDD